MKRPPYRPAGAVSVTTFVNREVAITVLGLLPQPGGSKRGFVLGRRALIVDANPKAKKYQEFVATAVRSQLPPNFVPFDGPVSATVTFVMPRPKHHFKKDGTLKDDAPYYHTVKPDGTKLWRALEDALTKAGVWTDDARVATQHATKIYTTAGADNTPRFSVMVAAL